MAMSFFREIHSYRNYLQLAEAKLIKVKLKNLGNSQVTHCISVTKKTCQCYTYTILWSLTGVSQQSETVKNERTNKALWLIIRAPALIG